MRIALLLTLFITSNAFIRAQSPEPDVLEAVVTETFYQELEVRRAPQFVIQEMNVTQQIHYRVLSAFQLYEPDAKGNFKAVQTISSAKLVAADPLSQAVFTESLAKLRGCSFTYQVDRNREVISMAGHQDNTEVVPIEKPDSMGTLVSTVIDEDGWKELAQLTLFRPLDQRRPNDSFSRKAAHDWGSLGSWYGKTTFVRSGVKKDLSQYRYQHQLEYLKPNGPGDLPFAVVSAQFQAYEASGVIEFDTKAKRVREVRELFHAKGRVEATMLGIPTTVDISERQEFKINITNSVSENSPNHK